MAGMCRRRRAARGGYSQVRISAPRHARQHPVTGVGGLAQSWNPRKDSLALTPPLFQLLYAPIYQAPRLSPAGLPAARRPLGAR